MKKYSFKNNKGFTIIEVVVAMAILSVALISVITLSTLGVKTVVRSKSQTEAISYAQYAMEILNQKAGVDGTCNYTNRSIAKELFEENLGIDLPDGVTGTYTISDVSGTAFDNNKHALATVTINTSSYDDTDTITLKQVIDRN